MDRDASRAAGCSTEAGGNAKLVGEKASATSSGPRVVPGAGRVLRERGISRSQTVASSPVHNNSRSDSGRVLRDRSSRRTTAWRDSERSSKTSGQVPSAVAKSRRKPEHPRRRRNTGSRSETSKDTGDDSGLPMDSEDKKESLDKDTRGSRIRRPQAAPRERAASVREPRATATLVCKSEPESEPQRMPLSGELCLSAESADNVVNKSGGSEDDERGGGDEDDVLISEEDPPFRDDPSDLNYKPEDEREPQKPRRRVPRQKEKKDKEIKMEEGDDVSVKVENEFGEDEEPPRKRGRRRKDDKSPRLPKRRKKPPVQYVRCEMEGCGTVLAHPRYLQHHIKYQHLLKKKYVCPHPSCGRLFRLQKQLLRHAKHHTDQRDYICEYCARAFKSSHNLAVHRMIHTGEKPLQCEICGFTCRQKASLNWHMKKHDADAFYQFSCSICGKKFEKKDSVVAHKAKSHPEVLIAEALAANAGSLITTPAPLLEGLPGVGTESGAGVEQVVSVGGDSDQALPPVPVPISMPLVAQQSVTPLSPQTQLPLLPQSLGLGSICPLAPSSVTTTATSGINQALVSEAQGSVIWEGEGLEAGGVVWEQQGRQERVDHGQMAWDRHGQVERQGVDGGLGWEREGSRDGLLGNVEEHVHHGTHHGLM
ncbi:E3 ubiquitin-protein ligase ZFP91-like isoform X1 [Brienomyrus brachyistius]|uniref:E3 ubiquitin-protein ligase ZFP91-like isoform X1 n=1 Tax=Brienomyrus brachyistius TaxID=42636 RepID=UPI0020B3AEB3|nr:E3 ubiquitin-protein ligase ZFP91-like isoform X1 [Brienomyrus brachyistius]